LTIFLNRKRTVFCQKEKIMPVIRAAEAPTFEMPGFHITGYTSPSRGATEICTWRIQIEPGTQSEPHWLDHEETFLGLAGKLSFSVSGEEIELGAGDALAIPARTVFQLANQGTQLASVIACLPVGAQGTMADGRVVGVPLWAR
jgi:quercetin dioxygenase-like cupin family protein